MDLQRLHPGCYRHLKFRQVITQCLVPASISYGALFNEKHLTPLDDRPGLQLVQIHAAGDALASMIAAIPMGGTGTRQVLTYRPIA